MTYESAMRRMKACLTEAGQRGDLLDTVVEVRARPLTAEEVIGNPEHEDYPLVVGRERMMEATVRGNRGHAFTDMYGHWQGELREVCGIEPVNNYRRAIIVATLNSVMRFTGDAADTVHCKDSGPVRCAEALPGYVESEGLKPPFALIGYQPRFAEALSALGELRIADMDAQHIGRVRAGAKVLPPERADKALAGAGCAFVTGSTIVNGTIHRFLDLDIPTVFYGVTVAGGAQLLGLKRYCPASA
ncbi:MAG: DUF364 domain-containing protein [Candidatus Brocadiia bacterium]